MSDLDEIGGVPVVLAHLLDEGLPHGDALTVSGKTMAENLHALNAPKPDGDVVHDVSRPIHARGGKGRGNRHPPVHGQRSSL